MNVILDEAKKILNFNIVSFINNKGFENAIKSRINSINEKTVSMVTKNYY